MSQGDTHEGPNTKRKFIAHRREKDGGIQDLWEHAEETSALAGKFASKIGLGKHGELIGLLHDLGKASFEFDQYIRSATGLIDPDEDNCIDVKDKKGKIDHSHRSKVAPRAGAWIETITTLKLKGLRKVAPLAGAWIETSGRFNADGHGLVAPRAGGFAQASGYQNVPVARLN
ncbi:hypothetical protein JCM15765_45500 [Paradesulfitobacterium aromaticivorans]